MIGFPVLEIDTSCNVLLKTREALSGLRGLITAHKPLWIWWAEHFCIFEGYTIKSFSTREQILHLLQKDSALARFSQPREG